MLDARDGLPADDDSDAEGLNSIHSTTVKVGDLVCVEVMLRCYARNKDRKEQREISLDVETVYMIKEGDAEDKERCNKLSRASPSKNSKFRSR